MTEAIGPKRSASWMQTSEVTPLKKAKQVPPEPLQLSERSAMNLAARFNSTTHTLTLTTLTRRGFPVFCVCFCFTNTPSKPAAIVTPWVSPICSVCDPGFSFSADTGTLDALLHP